MAGDHSLCEDAFRCTACPVREAGMDEDLPPSPPALQWPVPSDAELRVWLPR